MQQALTSVIDLLVLECNDERARLIEKKGLAGKGFKLQRLVNCAPSSARRSAQVPGMGLS